MVHYVTADIGVVAYIPQPGELLHNINNNLLVLASGVNSSGYK